MLIHLQQPDSHGSSRALADQSGRVWPRWPYIVMLCVLFFGPLVAPLFQATGLWGISDSGALARDLLARYVCPTPAKSYMLAGFPMAVCARCWGATIGLWVAYLFVRQSSKAQGTRQKAEGNQARQKAQGKRQFSIISSRLPFTFYLLPFTLCLLPFLLWVAEIRWWPSAPLWALLLNGALAGFAAGVFFCSLWPGMTRDRA